MRLHFRLLAATAIVAACFVAPAHAEPISAAIGLVAAAGSVGGAVAGAGTVGALLVDAAIAVGVSYGLSSLSQALQSKPAAGQALSGLETQVQIGGDVARQISVGTTLVKGQLVFHNTNGGNNEFYQRVFVLSDWRHESLNAIYMNGQRYPLTEVGRTDTHVAYTVFGTAGYVNLDFWFGRQGAGEADELLVQSANPAGKWTANSTLTGLCYVAVQFTYYKDAPYYQNGIPDLGFELGPACLYDWRQDSSAGGAGDQRWDDTLTWRPSENPFVGLYNYQRGFHLGGERIIGMGTPAYDFVLETYTAAANVCDEIVTKEDGTTEPRYRCSIVLSADEDVTHEKTIDAFLATCAGYLYDYGGSYVAQAGAAQYPIAPITDDDLVIGAPVSFAAKRSRAELVNTIHGQYLDVASGWQPQSYAAQISDGGIVNDGEVLGKPLDLLNVASKSQAERIARARLRESRAQGSAKLTVGSHRLDVQVGDWLPWNSARFGTRTWRVQDRRVDKLTKAVTLDLAEINAAVYSWTAADETPLPALPIRLQPGGRISTVSGFGAQAIGVRNEAGTVEIPGLRFFWTPISDDTVDAVVIEYRQLGTIPATRVTDSTPTDGELVVTSGIVNATDYEYRATIRTTPARTTTWTPWVSMRTTPSFAVEVGLANLNAQLAGVINTLLPEAIAAAQQAANDAKTAGQAALTDLSQIVRASLGDPTVSTVAARAVGVIRADNELLAQAVAAMQERLEQVRGSLVEAGVDQGTDGVYRISGVLETQAKLQTVSLTLSALDAKIALIAQASISGDLNGVITQLTTVSQTLDAVAGQLTSKVDRASFDGQVVKVTSLQAQLDAQEGEIQLRATLQQLSSLTETVNTAVLQIQAIQITASVIATQTGQIDDALRDRTLADILDFLSSNLGQIGHDFTTATSSISARFDDQGRAVASFDLRLAAQVALAAAQYAETVRLIVSGDQANADAATALSVRVAGAETAIVVNASLEATHNAAQATSIAGIQGTVYDQATGLAATLTRIVAEEQTRNTQTTALASRAGALEATVNGPNGVAATSSNLYTFQQTQGTLNTSLVQRASSLESAVFASGTGLAATFSRVVNEEQTRAGETSSLASRAGGLEATVYGPTGNAAISASLTSFQTAQANQNQAFAGSIDYLNSVFGGYQASTNASLTSLSNQYGALSAFTAAVNAKADQGTAGGQLSLVAIGAPSGYSAAFQLQLTANGSAAGLYVYVDGYGNSRIALNAASVMFVDPGSGTPFTWFSYSSGLLTLNSNVRIAGELLLQNAITKWVTFTLPQTGLANANQVLSGSELTLNVDYPGFVEMEINFDISATGAFYAYAEVDGGGLFSWPIVTMNTTPSNSDSNRRWVSGRISLEVGGGNHSYRIRVQCNNATLWNTRGSVKITKR